jgi:hypothetical protein
LFAVVKRLDCYCGGWKSINRQNVAEWVVKHLRCECEVVMICFI